jgi:hypothetical protein
MSLVDDQPAREIGWSDLKQMGLILEGSYAVYPLIRWLQSILTILVVGDFQVV